MKKNTNKQIDKNKRKKYIFSILLVFVLLLISLIGPGLLFDIHDNIQVRKTWQGSRNSLDIKILNSAYANLEERLLAFAKGVSDGKKYYASSMEVGLTKEDQYSIIEQAMPTYYYSNDFSVVDWKKYIIFDSALIDNNASVAFMIWYVELTGKNEENIKILVDMSDLTVYYIKVDNFTDADILSKQFYTFDEKNKKLSFDSVNYLHTYYMPDYIEYETKADIYMYFDNYPLHWECITSPYLQVGFTDMRALIPEFEE